MSLHGRSLSLLTAPVTEPIGVDEAKDHMRVLHTDDDAYITLLITAARGLAEGYLKRAIMTQTWDWKFDNGFPLWFSVPFPPLQSVTFVKYIDNDGVLQTVATSVYEVDTDAQPGRIALKHSQIWPTPRTTVIQNVQVQFVAGYADVGSVPEEIKQGIKLAVDHYYNHRGAVTEMNLREMPMAWTTLLWPYSVDIL